MGEKQRLGRVAAGTAKGVIFPPKHPIQRIVAAGGDVTVMDEEAIGNAAQTGKGILVVHDDGVIG